MKQLAEKAKMSSLGSAQDVGKQRLRVPRGLDKNTNQQRDQLLFPPYLFITYFSLPRVLGRAAYVYITPIEALNGVKDRRN